MQTGRSLQGLRVSVSGSGNVAQYAVEKAIALGATVITVSDSSGTVVDEEGFTPAKLAELMDVKNKHYGRVDDYASASAQSSSPGPRHGTSRSTSPCPAPRRTSSPPRTRRCSEEWRICVAEGANMPSTTDAIRIFEEGGVLFAPGKASNAGGVATSGLEMSQNAMRLSGRARKSTRGC